MKSEQIPTLVLDDVSHGVFTVHRKAFYDEAIFAAEMERIFENNWVFLAHESQIPNPHDFMTTTIGRQPVILTRTKAMEIKGFLNSCPHRGAALCRTVKGNKPYITCPYHGWVFDSAGKNMEIKDLAGGGYPEPFLKESHDLVSLGRVEAYRGFVFGSINPNVKPLNEHLGEAKVFIDLLADQSTEGLEVLKGYSAYTSKSNWKLQSENGVDGYHFTTVHANYVQMVTRRLTERAGQDNIKSIDGRRLMELKSGCYDLGNGHVVIWAEIPNAADRALAFKRDEVIARVGETKAKWMLERMRNLLLFPNVLLMDHASTQIRVIRPIRPDLTEVTIYGVAPKDETPEARERRIRQYEDFFNASGMATPDDLAEFDACQKGFQARAIEWQQGYERGLGHMTLGPDEEAKALGFNPASSGSHIQDETLYHGQYRRWQELMQGVV